MWNTGISGDQILQDILEMKEEIKSSIGTGQYVIRPIMVEQFRFPKSKKKRIRKKFEKNMRNYKPSKIYQ